MAVIITLGAGHGGIDSGAIGPTGLREKDCTLAVALKAGQLLSETGAFEVKLLRSTDVFIGVRERGEMAAKLGSRCHVEIHFNAFNNKASYVEVFHSVRLPGDAVYAQKMSARIACLLGVQSKGAEVRKGSIDKSGAYTDYYGVIDAARVGGVTHIFFPECGFIDFPQTESLLKRQSTLDSIAAEIAKTVCELFSVAFNVNSAQLTPNTQNTQPNSTVVPEQKPEKVRAGKYYVREKPAFDARIIGVVSGGEAYCTTPAENGFRCIILNGKTGYVGPGAWLN